MQTINRRFFTFGLACAVPLSSCAVERPSLSVTWVWLKVGDGDLAIYVDDEEVEISRLDAAVLAHAMAANPGRTPEDVRRNVRIFVRADPGLDYGDIVETMHHIRFEKIGFVGEDRRS